MRDHDGTIVVTYSDGRPVYLAEPGGRPISSNIVNDMLRSKMIEPRDDGLIDGIAQTYRLTAKMR
jgi:hypothetical protein